MEWIVIAIVAVVYVIVSNLEDIRINFKSKRSEPPHIEEPNTDTKQLKK